MPRVLVAVPGEQVMIQEITEGIKQINKLVDGSLECYQLGKDYTLFCNQEAIVRDLPVNSHFAQGIIKGPFVIAKKEVNGSMIGLDESDIRWITNTYIRDET